MNTEKKSRRKPLKCPREYLASAFDISDMVKEKNKPTIQYSDLIAKKLCVGIALGCSINNLSKMDGMPNRTKIFTWIARNTKANKNDKFGFGDLYLRARAKQQNIIPEQMLALIEECPHNTHDIQLTRLKIDALKWSSARLWPHMWDDQYIRLTKQGEIDERMSALETGEPAVNSSDESEKD